MSNIHLASRGDTITAIADAIGDRHHYIAFGISTDQIVHVLTELRNWTCYLDSAAADSVAVITAGPGMAAFIDLAAKVADTMAVITIPKTTPRSVMRRAFQGQEFDGTRDLVMLHHDGPIMWPGLFIDALAVNDPAAAAQICASDISQLN